MIAVLIFAISVAAFAQFGLYYWRATISGIARQPEVQGRLYTTMFLIVGLVEGMYFINLAFMALFVFVLAKG